MKVSAVIPTRNRARILRECLKSLDDFHVADEIIVVDCSSDDNTYHLVKEFSAATDKDVVYSHTHVRGSPKARNLGLDMATGEIVIMLDDDVLVPNNHLKSVVVKDFIDFRDVGIIGGKIKDVVKPRIDPPFYVKGADMLTTLTGFVFLDIGYSSRRFVLYIPAPCAIRKEVATRLRYDENFKGTAYREESDYQLETRKKGWKILFDPEFFVYHCGQQSGGNRGQLMAERMYWKARNHIYFLRKHSDGIKLFWRLLCSFLILGTYRPQYVTYVISGFTNGLKSHGRYACTGGNCSF